MKWSISTFVAFSMLLAFNPAIRHCMADPDIKELERQSIMYRLEHTKRGFVRMRVSNEIHPAQQTESLYELTYDENRTQQVRRYRFLGNDAWGKPEKLVVTPKGHIDDIEFVDTPVQVAPLNTYKNPREHFGVPNPQLLGMVRGGASALHILGIEDLLNRSDAATTVHSDGHDGLETWRIDYLRERKDGPGTSIWISPSQGYSVVKIEMRSGQNGKGRVETTDSQLKQYPGGKVWYPERVVQTVMEDGRIFSRQVVYVEEARFGGPTNEKPFTLAGLELKPGREVVDSTSGLPWGKVWNGKELVDPSGVPTAPANPDRRRWLLWTLAVGLALMAGFYLRRVIKQRRAASNPGG